MLSMLKQILTQEKSEEVRICAAKSLGILINYIQDEDKYAQSIELLDSCLRDACGVRLSAQLLVVPSLALWSMQINKFLSVFMTHYMRTLEKLIESNVCVKVLNA